MINLYSLKYFYDSYRLKSMTKAAELNNVSRPAISQAIKKLEEELKAELLIHKPREVELTQMGLLLAKEAEQIFSKIESVTLSLKGNSKILRGDLKIGSARTLATFLLQNILSNIRHKHPLIDLKTRIHNSEELMQKLIDREIDIAFFIGDETLPGYSQVVIKKGYFNLVKPKKLKFESALYAVTQKRPETEKLSLIYEKKYSRSIPIFAEIPSWDAIWTWTNNGLCGGLIPDFLLGVDPSQSKHLTVVLDKIWPYEVKVMFPTSRKEDPLIKTFLEESKTGQV